MQLAEALVAITLLSVMLPEALPRAIGLALMMVLLVALTALNVAIRRRLIPHE